MITSNSHTKVKTAELFVCQTEIEYCLLCVFPRSAYTSLTMVKVYQ